MQEVKFLRKPPIYYHCIVQPIIFLFNIQITPLSRNRVSEGITAPLWT